MKSRIKTKKPSAKGQKSPVAEDGLPALPPLIEAILKQLPLGAPIKALPVTWEKRPPKKAALISPFTPAANQFPPPTDSLHRESDATSLIQQFLSYSHPNSAHLFLGGAAPGTSTLSEQKSCFNLTIHSINCQPFDNICSPAFLYNNRPSCTIVGKKLEKR